MNKPVIYAADIFQDEVELVDRAFLASEMLYFLNILDEIPEEIESVLFLSGLSKKTPTSKIAKQF